ncbi:MAG: O-antigen ligase family protein [Candidatus Omnitrophota bacterium]
MTEKPYRQDMHEEERPIIEFPALVKLAIALGALMIGSSLLVLPWAWALALFVAIGGMIAIFFDPYAGLIAFLVGALLHPLEFFSEFFANMHISTILAVVIMFIWAFHVIVYKDFKIVNDKLNILVFLFGVTLFISTLGLFDFSFPQFIDFVKLFILYFLVVNLVRTRKKFLIMIWGLVVLGAAACLIGVYQHYTGIGADFGEGYIRIKGTATDPNDYAMHLVILVPIVFALFVNYRNILVKGMTLAVLLLLILNIVFTYSRGGLVAFAFVLALSVLGFSFQRKKFWLPIILVAIGTAALLPMIPEKYWERAKTISDFSDPAIQARLDTWKTGLEMIGDHPVRGVGLGVFRYEYLMRAFMGSDVKTKVSLFSHNAYIQIGAEVGLPALTLFILIIAFGWFDLSKSEKAYIKKGDMLFAGIALSLKLGLLGYMICAVFLTQAFLTMFWIILPLAVVSRKLCVDDTEAADGQA